MREKSNGNSIVLQEGRMVDWEPNQNVFTAARLFENPFSERLGLLKSHWSII